MSRRAGALVGRRATDDQPGPGAEVDPVVVGELDPLQSTCGRMLRLTERRPTSRLVPVSGTTTGIPADGHGSSVSCAAYQSGSTQTSATHSTGGEAAGAGGVGGEAAGPAAPATPAAGDGVSRGSCPVVKSYPQSSQNNASGAFAPPQCGQDRSGTAAGAAASRSSTEAAVAVAGRPGGAATGDGAAADGGDVAAADAGSAVIGVPQTSQ